MKNMTTILICLVLAACGGGSEDKPEVKEEKVFDPLIQSVDKAKAVEDTVLQQKKDMDEAMRRMEEGVDDTEEDQ